MISTIALFIMSAVTLAIAHYFKMLRWKQFIEVYEPPKERNLLISLTLGYTVSFFLPFKILGDILRGIVSGRKMKNGISFSLSTIVLDRYLDVLAVAIIYIVNFFIGSHSQRSVVNTQFYIVFSILLVGLAFVMILYSKIPKRILQKSCSLFNDKIELNLLLFFWSFISSFKDLCKKIQKKRLLGLTALMWFFYLASYYMLAHSASNILGDNIGLSHVFGMLFSVNNFKTPVINIIDIRNQLSFAVIFSFYILLSLIFLLVITLLMKNSSTDGTSNRPLNLLPHISNEDKLNFLNLYFSSDNREYINKYLTLNRNISIIKDFSAGSNATTILCRYNGNTFFRKYSLGKDSSKLNDQITWIESQQGELPLPEIVNKTFQNDCCSYDMPFNVDAQGLFDFVHQNSIDSSWNLIEQVLNTLKTNLYEKSQTKLNEKLLREYIDSKVKKNICKIKKAPQLASLMKYNEIFINGEQYKNLTYFESELSFENLINIFSHDSCSIIHGDLTIENIICEDKGFYLIDPNTGNVHDTPNLDFAKLLQSLHGNYEFLMRTNEINIIGNCITYPDLSSEIYHKLFKHYKKYLATHFDAKTNKSIFYHEIVHWLRLMPYKIEKNGDRALLFYAGLIKILNDVIETFN